jgi:parallel beta-helix repeat protein
LSGGVIKFFILFTALALIGNSQAALEQCTKEPWSPEYNNTYNNWTTFTKSSNGISFLCYNMKILKDINVAFAWNKYSDENFSRYKRLKIYQNGKPLETYSEAKKNYPWSESNQLFFKKGDDITWEFLFTYSGDHQVWLAFPPEVVQPFEKQVPNKPPEQPEILSGPDEGFNDTLYNFTVKAIDPEGNKLNYSIDWGDGIISPVGPFISGDTVTVNHSWKNANIYEVKAIAYDSAGIESRPAEKKIRINWLVKVPSGVLLQPIIDSAIGRLHSKITFILEGKDYDGPLNITNTSDINISSKYNMSTIKSKLDDYYFVIGLENTNNITINKLNITNSLDGIYINNSSYCKILNNRIFFKSHGIQVWRGHDNIIERNDINGSYTKNFANGCAGISLEDAWKDTIICNNISALNNLDSLYYIRNSTFKEFKIIVPTAHGNIIQCDPSKNIGSINGDECCCNFTMRNWVCKPCLYDSNYADIVTTCHCNVTMEICQ